MTWKCPGPGFEQKNTSLWQWGSKSCSSLKCRLMVGLHDRTVLYTVNSNNIFRFRLFGIEKLQYGCNGYYNAEWLW